MRETNFDAVPIGGYFLAGLKTREDTYIKKTPAWAFRLKDKDYVPFLAGEEVMAISSDEVARKRK